MAWQQLIFTADQSLAEQLESVLFAVGADAVSFLDAEDQPLFEPLPNTNTIWEKTKVVALFDINVDIDEILQSVSSALGETRLPPYSLETLADQDWERSWMDDFNPMQFGEKLWICPSWCEPVDPEAINIKLDPGLAFGTGTHETTSLCLEWLEQNDIQDLTMIDYGCGSGVLAIAACLLGVKKVWAVDYHPQAIQATQQNSQENNISPEKIIALQPEELPDLKADLIVANILAQPLIELAPRMAELLKPEGRLILSGILAEQTDLILAAYKDNFTLQDMQQKHDWMRIEFKYT